MKTKLHSPVGTSGNTLMVTVVIVAILGFLVATYMTLTYHENRVTMRSQAWNLSMALVEAGIEEAMAHLNVNGSNSIGKDGWVKTGDTSYKMSRWLGDNSYYTVTITNYRPNYSNSFPIIVSRGYVPLLTAVAEAPTGPILADFAGNPNTPYIGRGVRAQMAVDRLFSRGMVAKLQIDLNGNNIMADSFDSTDPRYSTNGLYYPPWHRANADVASNSGITNAVKGGNADIYGHLAVGPKGSALIGAKGSVGDLAWVDGGNYGIQDGALTDDMNMSFPDVKEPNLQFLLTPTSGWVTNVYQTVNTNGTTLATTTAYPTGSPLYIETNLNYSTTYPSDSPGPITTNFNGGGVIKGYYYPIYIAAYSVAITNTTITAAYYDYIFDTGDDSTPGSYKSATLKGTVYVRGQVAVYVTDTLVIDALTIHPRSRLNLYCSASSAALAGNHTLNSDGFADSFHFWGLPSCTSLTLNGNAGFTGTIYAPEADFDLGGSGSSVVLDLIGASITKSVTMNGHFNFHYDESLARFGPARGYYVVHWEELNPEEVPLIKLW